MTAQHSIAIAIDGPAASGKSTLGAALAQKLGYLYLDTGVMYRAATLAALRQGISLNDETAIGALVQRICIDVQPPHVSDGRQYTVLLDGQDVTWDLRLPEVEAGVSIVSAYPSVRAEMVRQQRQIAHQMNVVMVGRDIGTVVLPDATVKIYLDASVEERAGRRWREILSRGESANYEDILAGLRARDQLDTSRPQSPLRPAEDAIIIDSTHHTAEEIISLCYNLVVTQLKQKAAKLSGPHGS
ncbi:MAG: (d)CMP kinase [Anaerolineae bacterium]|nr:(d)CMP kinase [Thermoflexales bacterium]MDW8407914.1 (d)CMP kinase [Anaerolineae bacterium]